MQIDNGLKTHLFRFFDSNFGVFGQRKLGILYPVAQQQKPFVIMRYSNEKA